MTVYDACSVVSQVQAHRKSMPKSFLVESLTHTSLTSFLLDIGKENNTQRPIWGCSVCLHDFNRKKDIKMKNIDTSVLILVFLHVFVLFMYILWNKYV